jgi:hypothetical protein
MFMKKISLLILVAIATVATASAQNYKWWIGGKSTLWVEDNRTTFIVAPEVGYHLSPKLTLAASAGLHSYTYNNTNHEDLGFVLNPYLRYSVFSKGNLLLFVDGGIEYGVGDIQGFQIGFKPGMAIFLSDRFTAAFQVGFVGYNDGEGVGGRRKGTGFDLSGYQSGFAIFYSF